MVFGRRRWIVATACLLGAAAFATLTSVSLPAEARSASFESSSPAPSSHAQLTPTVPEARPISIGVTVSGDVDSVALDSYSKLAGRSPALVLWYQSWAEPIVYPRQLLASKQRGITPVITWIPQIGARGVPLRAIARGTWDRYLLASALLAKSASVPLLVRFAHEMNLKDSAYGPGQEGNTAADFIAAWRHVVSVFRASKVTNVRWVWSPNVDCHRACPFSAFYPGDAYVDWVGLDGYNYAGTSHLPWTSLADVFSASYISLTRLTTRPLMICETGSSEFGGDKAKWIRVGLLADLPRLFPRVRAVIWFDRLKETDWRVNSSAAVLLAWRDVVASRQYSARALQP